MADSTHRGISVQRTVDEGIPQYWDSQIVWVLRIAVSLFALFVVGVCVAKSIGLFADGRQGPGTVLALMAIVWSFAPATLPFEYRVRKLRAKRRAALP